jgi:hypothetical protein
MSNPLSREYRRLAAKDYPTKTRNYYFRSQGITTRRLRPRSGR